MLAAKCNLLGWPLSRETLAKLEIQVRWISDSELLCLARALDVSLDELLPERVQQAKALRTFFAAFERK